MAVVGVRLRSFELRKVQPKVAGLGLGSRLLARGKRQKDDSCDASVVPGVGTQVDSFAKMGALFELNFALEEVEPVFAVPASSL